MLKRTKELLNRDPNVLNPREKLIEVLYSAIELLSLLENDFGWSSWLTDSEATKELKEILSVLEHGDLPDRSRLSAIFGPTGPMQEVSLSSGWGETFIKLADRYDFAERSLW